MKLTITVALFTCLVLLGTAQKFTGGKLLDIYTDQITVFQNAKADFDSSMATYSAMKNPKMAAYKDVMAARKIAMEAMKSARQAILDRVHVK